MNNMLQRIIFGLMLTIVLVACGEKDVNGNDKQHNAKTENAREETKKHGKDYVVAPVLLKSKSVASLANSVASVYKKANRLVFTDGNGTKSIISDTISSKHYWLATAGNYVHVFWWEKFANLVKGEEKSNITGKVIYARSSSDSGKTFGDKKIISRAGGVLPNVRIVADAKGHVSLVYLDERFGSFHIFVNSSQDGGKTWKADDIQMDHALPGMMEKKNRTAVSPNIAMSDNEIVVSWQQTDKDNNDKPVQRMYSRISRDFGKSWEKEVPVFDTDLTMSFSMDMYGTHDQVYLIAGMQEHGILLFTKKPKKSWQQVKGILPGSNKGKGGSYFRFAVDDKYLYVTYVFVEKVEGSKTFWHTELVRLDKGSNGWVPGSYRLDSRGMGVSSKGGYQDIVRLDDGTLVVVWEDFRRILPMIAMNYSTDQGETWLTIPLVLSRQDVVNYSGQPFIRKFGDNQFSVFYKSNLFPEQVRPEEQTLSVSLHSPVSKQFDKNKWALKVLPSDDQLKKRLTERFNVLRDARLNKKWAQAWPLQDPLYRNLYKKKMWLRTRDRLIYEKMDMDEVKLDNPYGYVLGKMVYSLDPDFIDADPKDPRFAEQKKNFVLKWGWFVDDWYLITESGTEPYLP